MAHSPIVARDVIIKDCGGITSAELECNPSSEIVCKVLVKHFLSRRFVISVGVHQGIFPSQYLGFSVLGVPPLLILPTSERGLVTHSFVNPGRRVLPVRSCCMAACLMARFLAISASSDSSNLSTSDNAPAMARCSYLFGGNANLRDLRESWLIFVLALTVLLLVK